MFFRAFFYCGPNIILPSYRPMLIARILSYFIVLATIGNVATYLPMRMFGQLVTENLPIYGFGLNKPFTERMAPNEVSKDRIGNIVNVARGSRA